MRHWTGIVGALAKDDVYCSGLLKEECGEMCCNNWTNGFFQSMNLCPEGCDVLLKNDDHTGCLVLMLMLHHEHDEDPEMRPPALTPAKREEVIAHMTAGLLHAYRYFRKSKAAK